ncbi:hypothetical protein HK097_001101 [Rhizophlyctis rosea]|uniref:Beta-xylanase n=1 Tax=Rhizophlyctis rosea TaxID=64517 RepID=A0AAD5SHU0_9FUNG|nr:hypothetical protein HK097_001101 [Rhizophlyctis rosea]
MRFVPLALAAGFVASVAGATLKSLAESKGIYIGAAADNGEIADPTFARIIGQEFHSTTPGNSMKWDAIEPSPGVFNYKGGDEILNFAVSKGMTVRGHTLVWHSQLPSWVSEGTWTKETLTAAIENHVTNVVTHYKGKLLHWDVVNEIFNEDGTLRDSVFSRTFGNADFVPIAFRAARAADPDVKLYINDYNVEFIGPKSDAMYTYVKQWLAEGVPIDGIGAQAHLVVGLLGDTFHENLARFTSLGVETALTELDIRGNTPLSAADSQQQKDDYEYSMRACVETDGCVGVTIWGFTDRYSWVPTTFPGEGDALPWDKNFQRKPAHDGIVLALGGTPEPTSTTTGTPTPTPTGRAYVHAGSGLEPGWQNWSWNMNEFTAFYDGPPTPVVGEYSLKAVTGEYGGLNLKGTEAAFKGKATFNFNIAGNNPDFSVRFEASAEKYQTTELQHLRTVCDGTITTDKFTSCKVDFTHLGDHAWDIVALMSHTAANQTIILSDVYVAEGASQATTTSGGSTATTTAVTTTTRGPLPTPTADRSVYEGGSLGLGWQNWSWDTVVDFAYPGPPAPVVGSSIIQATATNYGGLSFRGNAFGGYKYLVFSVAAANPNWSVRMEDVATAFEGSIVKLETFCEGTITIDKFTHCKVDLLAAGDQNWDRFSFMSHVVGDQVIYLSNIYLSADGDLPEPQCTLFQTVTLPAETFTVPGPVYTVTYDPEETCSFDATVTLPAETITVSGAPSYVTITVAPDVTTTPTTTTTTTTTPRTTTTTTGCACPTFTSVPCPGGGSVVPRCLSTPQPGSSICQIQTPACPSVTTTTTTTTTRTSTTTTPLTTPGQCTATVTRTVDQTVTVTPTVTVTRR